MTEKQNHPSDRGMFLLCLIFLTLIAYKEMNLIKAILVYWMLLHKVEAATVFGFIYIAIVALFLALGQMLREKRKAAKYLKLLTSDIPGSVFAGTSSEGERVFIPIEARRMHTQVIGTTNAGKSESVIIPWAVSDIRDHRGFTIVDGKADRSFIDKLYSYAKRFKRSGDFKVFSLQNPDSSHTFNPLIGGTTEEVSERVFNSFEFDNSYYESVQYEVFSQVLRIFESAKLIPTFLRVYQAIKNPQALHDLAVQGQDVSLEEWASGFKALTPSDRESKTSGLLAALSHFAFGSHAKLFNTDTPDIDLARAMENNELVYFQLPVMKAAFLGKATGKLVLQCLQSAVANRHAASEKRMSFFSVYLDDFTEYLYPGFVTLLNKSRSANVGVVFAHQALGDIEALGDDIATSILTNSNLKIVMRGNDPNSAEYFAKVIGTKDSEKLTERADKGLFGRLRTGQGSVREVEEFIVHPNVIKRNMGVGEALVVIPHKYGTKTVKLKFQMLPDLPRQLIPKPKEKAVLGLSLKQGQAPEKKSETMDALENLKEVA